MGIGEYFFLRGADGVQFRQDLEFGHHAKISIVGAATSTSTEMEMIMETPSGITCSTHTHNNHDPFLQAQYVNTTFVGSAISFLWSNVTFEGDYQSYYASDAHTGLPRGMTFSHHDGHSHSAQVFHGETIGSPSAKQFTPITTIPCSAPSDTLLGEVLPGLDAARFVIIPSVDLLSAGSIEHK